MVVVSASVSHMWDGRAESTRTEKGEPDKTQCICYAQIGKTLNERKKNIQNALWQYQNSHDTNFASWHFSTCQNALWLLQNIHDAKFRVVALLILPQRVLDVFFAH
jgi:hypothetical protein